MNVNCADRPVGIMTTVAKVLVIIAKEQPSKALRLTTLPLKILLLKTIGLSSVAVFISMFTAHSFAQTASANNPTTPADGVSETTSLVLEEVIVTAQKRTEDLQDVSVAVSVLDGQKIKDAGIQDLQELSAYVPNFTQTLTFTSNVIFIRGIGSGENPNFEQSVGVFHDGIYWGRGRQTLAPLYDLERIEVLKGPQGVLFGKNVIAGAVNSTSARPTDDFSADILLGGGSNDEQKFEFAVSGPISERLRARFALHGQSEDGWIKNEFTGKDGPAKDTTGVRLGLEFDAGDTLMGYLKLEWSNADFVGSSFEVIKNTTKYLEINEPPFYVIDALIPPHLVGLEATANGVTNIGNSTIPGPEGQDMYTDLANHVLQLDWTLGDYTATSVTGYSSYLFTGEIDLDFSPSELVGADTSEDYRQISQEFRIQSPQDVAFEYIGGIYLQRSELELIIAGDVLASGLLTGIFPDSLIALASQAEGYRVGKTDLDSSSYSVFFQGTYHLNDQWSLTLGGRYTIEEKDVEKDVYVHTRSGAQIDAAAVAKDTNGNYLGNETATPAFIATAIDVVWYPLMETHPYFHKDDRREEQFTPQITLEWTPLDSAMLYASATRGFKGGGYDGNHADGTRLDKLEFEEEEVIAFELGMKTQLMGGRMELNAALYQTEFDDQQVSIYNGTGAFNVSNAAAATSRGLEIEGRFLATANLEVTASVAFNDFAFDDYENGQCTVSDSADELLSVDVSNTDPNKKLGDITGCENDLRGETSMLAPENSASVSFIHSTGISQHLQWVTVLDANYSDDIFLSADLDPTTLQESYTKVNLRLALKSDAGWQIALLVKNLTEEETNFTADDFPFGNGNTFGSILCGLPTTSAAACDKMRNALVDHEGSFFAGRNNPEREYSLEARYRF